MYLKEGTTNYLKLQHNYILNIYNVTIDTYFDGSTSNEKAKIIAIDSDSADISYVVSTVFNIQQNNSLNIQQVLDQFEQLSESEKLLVITQPAIIVCLSSNFYFNNIDISSEYDNEMSNFYFFRFINPLYKNIRISNSNIGVSGTILYADKQVEATLENLKIDLHRDLGGIFFNMVCRNPTIIFNSTLNMINVELYHSQEIIDIVKICSN